MSYSLRIEARDRQESAATDWIEDEPAAALGDDDAETSVLRFSAGNPRVEHVTGVVHLYRHFNSTVQVGGCVSRMQLFAAVALESERQGQGARACTAAAVPSL